MGLIVRGISRCGPGSTVERQHPLAPSSVVPRARPDLLFEHGDDPRRLIGLPDLTERNRGPRRGHRADQGRGDCADADGGRESSAVWPTTRSPGSWARTASYARRTGRHAQRPRRAHGAGQRAAATRLTQSVLTTTPWSVRLTAVVDLGSNSFRLVVYRYEPGGAWAVWDEIRAPVRLSAGDGRGAGAAATGRSRARSTPCGRSSRSAGRPASTTSMAVGHQRAAPTPPTAPRSSRRSRPRGSTVRILDGHEEAYYGALAILNSTTVGDGFGLDMGGGSVQMMRLHERRPGRLRSCSRWARSAPRRSFLWASRRAGQGTAQGGRGRGRRGRLVGRGRGSWPHRRQRAQHRGGRPADERPAQRRRPGLRADRRDGRRGRRELAGRSSTSAGDRGDQPGPRGRHPRRRGRARDDPRLGGFDRVEVTDAGLREGLFFERYYADRDPPVAGDVARASVENLLLRHEDRPRHTRARVAIPGEEPWRSTTGLTKRSARSRRPRRTAGCWRPPRSCTTSAEAVGFDERHKHARYLILNEGLPGFTRDDMNDSRADRAVHPQGHAGVRHEG